LADFSAIFHSSDWEFGERGWKVIELTDAEKEDEILLFLLVLFQLNIT
jgi:hypothetical protein